MAVRLVRGTDDLTPGRLGRGDRGKPGQGSLSSDMPAHFELIILVDEYLIFRIVTSAS